MRLTTALVLVASALQDASGQRVWGYQICLSTGLPSGVLYPLLRRMLERGWVNDGWEVLNPAMERRPRRRYYVLTNRGEQELTAILDRARSDPRFTAASGAATSTPVAAATV